MIGFIVYLFDEVFLFVLFYLLLFHFREWFLRVFTFWANTLLK